MEQAEGIPFSRNAYGHVDSGARMGKTELEATLRTNPASTVVCPQL